MKSSTTRRVAIAVGVVGLAVLVLCWFIWRGRPPQIGTDEEVLKTVDALFTAITARDEKLVGQCEQRLHGYKAARKLPAEAADYLDGIVQRARAGRWESAAERLYEFMKAQRREQTRQPPRRRGKASQTQAASVRRLSC